MDGNGRYTLLSPAIIDRFRAELEVGDWPQMAAYRVGIAPTTLKQWVWKGCELPAIEPYATLVAMMVEVEAKLSGALLTVLMDDALGRKYYDSDEARPNPDTARWLLLNRFRFLWGVDKESGKSGGVSITEAVERRLEEIDVTRRERAREILKKLPDADKQAARKEGFLL